MWSNYSLGNQVQKATETVTLWRTENGIVEIDKNTLAIPIRQDDRTRGFVFQGKCKLLLDTIVETERGAIGKPVEKEIAKPFLMLGEQEKIQPHLTTVDKEDLRGMDGETEQELIAEAQKVCDQFFKRGAIHCCSSNFHDEHSVVFAFPNENAKFDTLIANGSKLVYKAVDRVFITNGDKAILKTPQQMAIAKNGRSFVVKTICCC
jgi:hypothetical protein